MTPTYQGWSLRQKAAFLLLVLVFGGLGTVLAWFWQTGRLTFVAATVVTVTSPNGGECFAPGESRTISWTALAGLNYSRFEVRLLPNGTSSGAIFLGSAGPTARNLTWSVPSLATTAATISLDAYVYKGRGGGKDELAGSDTSNNSFTIQIECRPPTIGNITTTGITTTAATVSWTTDQNASRQVEYGTSDRYGSTAGSGTVSPSPHSVSLSNLQCGTTYHFRIRARNSLGKEATSSDRTFTTATDTISPSPPRNLRSTGQTASSITLAWEASSDACGLAGYRIFRNTKEVGRIEGTTYTDAGLAAGTTYGYDVRAVDRAGNVSGISNPILVSTLSAGATPPPAGVPPPPSEPPVASPPPSEPSEITFGTTGADQNAGENTQPAGRSVPLNNRIVIPVMTLLGTAGVVLFFRRLRRSRRLRAVLSPPSPGVFPQSSSPAGTPSVSVPVPATRPPNPTPPVSPLRPLVSTPAASSLVRPTGLPPSPIKLSIPTSPGSPPSAPVPAAPPKPPAVPPPPYPTGRMVPSSPPAAPRPLPPAPPPLPPSGSLPPPGLHAPRLHPSEPPDPLDMFQ